MGNLETKRKCVFLRADSRVPKPEELCLLCPELWEGPLHPLPHPTLSPQAGDSLDLEAAQQQAAPLHHQHAVFDRLIQWVGEEHLHVQGLLHLGLVQHLWGEGLMESHLPLGGSWWG